VKNNTLISILTIIVLTLLVIVILGIYKFFETDKKLKETINLHDESIKEVLKLKDLIQKDYLVKSISSNKKEYSGNLLDGFKLNVEYDVQIKLIEEKLNYVVNFKNIPPHKDFENRLKNIEVLFFDSDDFELLRIDLSKPSNQYVNSETYHSSGRTKLTTEIYELIDSCGFSIHSLSEEEYLSQEQEYLSQEQTKNKNSEDWSSFLLYGMGKEEVIKLIGEPSSIEENEGILNLKYDLEDSFYRLTFSSDNWLILFEKISIMDSIEKIRWGTINVGLSISMVNNLLGTPDEESYLENNDILYLYNYDNENKGFIIFNKNGKVKEFKPPF
jgi:hypothetical protein